jgi:hypothetical protein
MNLNEIENVLIELEILSKFELNEKPKIRNGRLEIDPYSITQMLMRRWYADTFEKTKEHFNGLAVKVKSICKFLILLENSDDCNEIYKHDVHIKFYLSNINEKLIKCVEYGLCRLKETYSNDKNKVSFLQSIVDRFNFQITENKKILMILNDYTKSNSLHIPDSAVSRSLHIPDSDSAINITDSNKIEEIIPNSISNITAPAPEEFTFNNYKTGKNKK